MLASRDYPDFQGGITFAEIQKENGSTRTPEDDERLARARTLTEQLVAKSRAAIDAANKNLAVH